MKRYGVRTNKHKCRWSLLGLAAIVVCLSACASTTRVESVDKYLDTDIPLAYADHVLFPAEDALGDITINLYRSVSKSTFFYDDIYFLLSCTYEQQEFQQEVRRMEQAGAEYCEDLFAYPAYVMLFSGDRYYEYALINAEMYSVVYVYAEVSDWNLFDDFPTEYLPSDYESSQICKYS